MSSPIPPVDSEVHVFHDPDTLMMVPGEFCLATVTRVKVHPGRSGQLHITNIRLVWFIVSSPNINASIGYRTVVTSSVANGVHSGESLTEILTVRCKDHNTMYEFVFSAARGDQSVFRFFDIAYANYASATVLREQKLRPSRTQEGNLVMVAGEQVMLSLDKLANFLGDVATVGKAILTNIRFMWFSEIVNNFNVSIPLILLSKLHPLTSRRYGKCLFLRFNSGGAGFTYGFTTQPADQMIDFISKLEQIRIATMRMPRLTLPLDIKDKAGRD
jgi:Bardet-Biedl syndrome 5 protein